MKQIEIDIKPKIIADMHMHTYNSHDSAASVDSQCESAIEKGINIIAVTDHFDYIHSDVKDVFTSIENSYRDALRAGEKYAGKLEVLAGVELAEGILYPEIARKAVKLLDFDVVIGSVHTVRCKGYSAPYSLIDFNVPSDGKLSEFMNRYFEDMKEMINVIDFDILAHMTCPLRYINGKYKRGFDIHRYADVIDEILKLIIEKDIALEVNTSGYGTEVEFMPDRWIVERYVSLGGKKVTLGADAHAPENIGKGFDAAIRMLKENGVSCIYSFKARRPIKHEI